MIWKKIKCLMNNGFKFQSNHRKNVLVITLTKNKITYQTIQNPNITDEDFFLKYYMIWEKG